MFLTELELRATEPGEWALLAPLKWSGDNWMITVPDGFITDLASIPRLLRGAINQNGASRRPAVLHDWLYCSQICSRRTADHLFLCALKADGLGFLSRWAMYSAVRSAGWIYYGQREGMGLQDEDFM